MGYRKRLVEEVCDLEGDWWRKDVI